MAKRRRKKRARRKPRRAALRAGPTAHDKTPFFESPAGRLVVIAVAIVGMWLLVLAIYALSR